MSFIASDLINQTIEKTKKLLFPFNIIVWLKLIVLGIFAGGISSSSNSLRGINVEDFTNISNFLISHWQLFLLAFTIVLVLYMLLSFISSVFWFCLLDSIVKKKVLVFGYFKKNLQQGVSLFFLRLVVSFIMFPLLIILLIPAILTLVNNINNLSLVLFNIPYIIIVLLIWFLLMIFINIFISLVPYHMYCTKKSSSVSLSKVITLVKKNVSEIIIYLLILIAAGFLVGIAFIMLFVILILLTLLIGGLLFLIGFGLTQLVPLLIIPLIIIGVLLGFILLFAFFAALALIGVPIRVFYEYFKLDFMSKLLKKK